MGGSEEVSSMDLKETELTLGLPGEKLRDSNSSIGIKRKFSNTLDLNLGSTCSKGSKFDENEGDNQLEHPGAPGPSPPKAQLVGWPPVRASRKNAGKNSCKYVKVAVDGAPYLRKVDLELYSSYQQLLKALEDLFSCFTIRNFFNDGKLLDPVNGSEYVPTYEDKDGDWMMVGDVPWKMFVESCKRIRLMKGSEVVGLGGIRAFVRMSSIIKVDIRKFDGESSFNLWKVHMRVVLIHHRLWKVLQGPHMKPEKMTEKQWAEDK